VLLDEPLLVERRPVLGREDERALVRVERFDRPQYGHHVGQEGKVTGALPGLWRVVLAERPRLTNSEHSSA